MNDRLLSAISLCRKASMLKLGGDVVRQEALNGGAKLVLLCNDVAPRSVRQTSEVCMKARVPVKQLPFGMDELAYIVGKRYGILAVCDYGFAKMITGLLPLDDGPEKKT